MSNDNFEYGTLTFTKTGYSEVMRKMRTAYNERQEFFYELAVSLYEACKKSKLKRKDMFNHSGDEGFVSFDSKKPFLGAKTSSTYFLDDEDIYLLVNEVFRGKNEDICKPRKSAFKKLTNKQSGFSIDADCASITFNSDSHDIKWRVEKNNHAVQTSHEACMAIVFFSILGNYKWRRGEGGVFWYSDEYAGDDDHCSSRPESISHHFGPVGEKRRNDENKRRFGSWR